MLRHEPLIDFLCFGIKEIFYPMKSLYVRELGNGFFKDSSLIIAADVLYLTFIKSTNIIVEIIELDKGHSFVAYSGVEFAK